MAVLEPVPAVGTSVVVTPLAVFGLVPTVYDITTTVTVQLLLAGIVIPLKLRLLSKFAKLLPLAPVQVPPAFCAPLTHMLLNASVKLAFVIATLFGFVSVNVIVEVPPAVIGLVPNALEMVGWP